MALTATANAITLRGSVDIVTDFFNYAINSILYQRGIYPEESFAHTQQYGLTMLVTDNNQLKDFLSVVLKQMQVWLMDKTVHRLVVVITSIDTKETLERWEFNVINEQDVSETGVSNKQKELKEIQKEIRNIIRQITASVTFLPLLETECAFDVLFYTSNDTEAPDEWAETTAHFIPNYEMVSLNSFSTTIHKVEALVHYKSDI